ncbi:hypothetical protein J1614_006184 [Plenodomus biglobosus]|nr:hypothetical protein J1614_006184 [Plenodomus biglobosus]
MATTAAPATSASTSPYPPASPSTKPSPSMTYLVPTSIFIDQVPDYDLLSSCAEEKVSNIVRNMASGCGDGSRTTSFACFCYTSSSYYDSVIGMDVRTACANDTAEESKARHVFNEYCEIPLTAGLPDLIPVETTLSASSNLVSSTISLQSATTNSSPSANSSADTGIPRSTIIALSTSLPLLALLFAVGIFLFVRHRKKAKPAAATADATATTKEAHETVEIYTPPTELPEKEAVPYHVVELPVGEKGARRVAELEGGRS